MGSQACDEDTARAVTQVVLTGSVSGGPSRTLDAQVRVKRNKVIRRACAGLFWERVSFLRQVVDGEATSTCEVVTHKGDVKEVTAEPTITERLRALDLMGKYGRILEEDDPELPSEVHRKYDLTRLSDGQLHDLEKMLASVQVKRPNEEDEEPSGEVVNE